MTSGFFAKQVVFLTVNHRGPLPLRELHSTDETIVWRDPGGSWACLPPLYHCECHHLATDCDTCGEEPYQMLKWTKPHKKLGRRRPKKKTWKEAFRMKGAVWNSEQNKTTNSFVLLFFVCISILWLMLKLQIPEPWLYLFPFQCWVCFNTITVRDSQDFCTLFFSWKFAPVGKTYLALL